MQIRRGVTVLVFGLGLVCNQASAAILLYSASMGGLQEAPPNNSPATGTAFVEYDTLQDTIRVRATFTGLVGNTTAAHIHGPTALPGTGTAGVMTTTPSFVGFPLGVASGAMDQTFSLTLASTYNAAFITAQGGSLANARSAFLNALANGQTYFNVHTTAFPSGEIRGFLVAVPEPSSMALMICFVAAAGWRARRRHRRLSATQP